MPGNHAEKYVIAGALTVLLGAAWLKPHGTVPVAPPPAAPKIATGEPQPVPAPRAPIPAPKVARKVPERGTVEAAVELSKSVLPSKAERERLHAALQSPVLIADARARLLDLSERAATDEAETERMRSIDFLTAALDWKENLSRREALGAILEVLSRNVNEMDVSRELKQSLAGDVVELYGVLLQVDTDRAQDVFAHASPEQQRAYRLAETMVGERKGKVE